MHESKLHAVLKHKGTVECNSSRALSIFSNENINFVIVDSDFIKQSVCELIDTLRAQSVNNLIPIVVLANSDDGVFLSDCLASGISCSGNLPSINTEGYCKKVTEFNHVQAKESVFRRRDKFKSINPVHQLAESLCYRGSGNSVKVVISECG